jgi:acetyl-CoA C-acetyltransferase
MGTNPCIIGVATQTWRGLDAPEPLEMWAAVVADAARDCGTPGVLGGVDSLELVYCQTWQYDHAPRRLAERLGIDPPFLYYSGIGGTTPQQLVNRAAERVMASDLDIVVVASAEALATQSAANKRGERRSYRYPPNEKRPFPWEAPFHPSELAHEVFSAWLQFALFDNARRGHLGIGLDDYRHQLGEMLSPMTSVAAAHPDDAWFPIERSVDEIVVPRPDNRMVGYPYTKYMTAVMDVDMAAAVIVTCDEVADRLGVPRESRVYLRGWCYATDPVYVAEHAELDRSPAMHAAIHEALAIAGAQPDDVAHLDLYSCFGSSLNFARDALGMSIDDPRSLTVTGGLPYHGGPGSGYMTHSIAHMARLLREHPGELGLTTGVGMANTKHVAGVWSTTPAAEGPRPPDEARIAAELPPAVPIVEEHDGPATIAAYSVVHGRDGAPEWGLLVCDVDGPQGPARCYARLDDRDTLARAERDELVGTVVALRPDHVHGSTGDGVRHLVIR